MGVVFGVLLLLGVGCVVLDTARNRRPGTSVGEVLREVGQRPSDWQLVVSGLGFVTVAFLSTLTAAAALLALPVAWFLGAFLHGSRPQRVSVPHPREELAVPEPASNLRLL